MIIHKVCCQVLPYKRWKEMLPRSKRFEWSWVKSLAWYCNLDMAWQKAKLKTHFEKSPRKSTSCFLQATISYITMPTCSLFLSCFFWNFISWRHKTASPIYFEVHVHIRHLWPLHKLLLDRLWHHGITSTGSKKSAMAKLEKKTENCKCQVLQTDVWSF